MPPGREDGGETRDEEDPSRSSPPPSPLLPGFAVVPVESEKGNRKTLQHEQAEVNFPEAVLIEILSRVPFRSLCRFKCVSTPWLALCSDRGVLKRSPQTLSGFFHWNHDCRFQNLSGKGPPMVNPDLPFLRGTYKKFRVEQCSTSLLLYRYAGNQLSLWNAVGIPFHTVGVVASGPSPINSIMLFAIRLPRSGFCCLL